MTDFSLKLHFPTSRSKNFPKIKKLAEYFENFEVGETNVVTVLLKEIFEKWDYFCLLFWGIVDWKGTILELDEMKWHSHYEKTRLFYAIQEAKVAYICFIEQKYAHLERIYLKDLTYDELDGRLYSNDELNYLIEKFQIQTIKKCIADEGFEEVIKVPNRHNYYRMPRINIDKP